MQQYRIVACLDDPPTLEEAIKQVQPGKALVQMGPHPAPKSAKREAKIFITRVIQLMLLFWKAYRISRKPILST